MDAVADKARQWIENGQDPRSAYWQVALESILDAVADYLEPGRLSPVPQPGEEDLPVFLAALEAADLSPGLRAAFLPPAVADKITPPEVYTEIQRLEPGQPSYKLLIARPDTEMRLLCAEISGQAQKPGADIFQSGELLGTYDFKDRQEFLEALPQMLRAHLWEKTPWQPEAHRQYTRNWLEKVLLLKKKEVAVNPDMSYFHSPTRIKSDRVSAIFTLLAELLLQRAAEPTGEPGRAVAAIRAETDPEIRQAKFTSLAETALFDMLAVLKECELIPFAEFSAKENEQFKQETAQTVRFLVSRLNRNG